MANKPDFLHTEPGMHEFGPNKTALLVELRDLRDKNPEQMTFGPAYTGQTSHNEKVEIATIFRSRENPRDGTDGRKIWNYFLLETLESQPSTLAGYRTMEFATQPELKNQPAYVHGQIRAAKKQQGLAMPIEIANLDILQRESDAFKLPVIWKIYNYNKTQLDEMFRENRDYPGTFSAQFIAEAQEEQKRWLKIYGAGGLLGCVDDSPLHYKKQFNPRQIGANEVPQDLSRVEVSRIQSDDSLNFQFTTQPIGDPIAFQKQQQEFLNRLILNNA